MTIQAVSELDLSGSGDGLLLLVPPLAAPLPTESVDLFTGTVTNGAMFARFLVGIAAVAGSRWHENSGPFSDPVVTTDGAQLRFESVSGCCGVYARLDVLPGGLVGSFPAVGTTNIDIGPELQTALRQFEGSEALGLEVRTGGVTVSTTSGTIVEPAVRLPERWLTALAESAVILAAMDLRAEVHAREGLRFLRSITGTSTGRGQHWVTISAGRLRDSGLESASAVCLTDAYRLAPVMSLLPRAESVRFYGAPAVGEPACGAIEVVLASARLTILLSPAAARGLGGEGRTLDQVDSATARDNGRIWQQVRGRATVDAGDVATENSLSVKEARAVLFDLAAQGRLGYDLSVAGFFPRELPDSAHARPKPHPRLATARRFVADGVVRTCDGYVAVATGDHEHHVRFGASGASCTCTWWVRYRGSRGQCSHILAAELVESHDSG